jgi:acyl-CoA synthetase (AMP-forming)/AMP-acid ligase II
LANRLLGWGLKPGDRVALLAQNSPLYVEAYFGILKAGGVAVPLNTASDPGMLAYFLRDCGARVLIVGPRMERLVHKSAKQLADVELVISPNAGKLARLPCERVAWTDTQFGGPDASDGRPTLQLSADDVASIIYTSGSTGRPRGATLTHGNIAANVASIVEYLELTAADRVLQVLPFYYVYGKSVLNTHVAVGASVVIETRFQYPNVALDTLEAERCTGFSGVPSTFAILLNRSNLAKRELACLRYVTQAGGGMSPALTRRLMHALPERVQIVIMYGATEASARLAYLPPELLAEHVGSIGRAIPGVTLRVLRPDASECDVDEVGELVARGPNIMRGYWNAPEETARVLDDDGYHTGDLARRDAGGFLHIVGRTRDMVKAGGHRIATKEIEDAILEHDAIDEVAVIGVPDELLGEQVKAVAVLRPNAALDLDTLAKFLSTRVPPYKIPRFLELRSELPKNESGKIMKQALHSGKGSL